MTTLGLKINVAGLSETVAAMEEVPRAIQRRVLVKAVRAGGAPFLDAIRASAPTRTRNLKRSMTLVLRRFRSGVVMVIIGQERSKRFKSVTRRRVDAGGLSRQGKAVPIHIVENDTKPHKIPKMINKPLRFRVGGKWATVASVDHPGTRGSGFAKRAATTAEASAIAAFSEKYIAEANAEINTIAAKATKSKI